jgi:hypothetical protein
MIPFAPSIRRLALVILAVTLTFATAAAQTPEASPVPSPVAFTGGCEDLEPYFLHLASLIRDNEGLALMKAVAFDALALSEEDAETVATSIDDLIARVREVSPPEPAAQYQQAYLAMLTWYRDLAANRDPMAHQQLINNDRRLFAQIGIAVQQGQSACGATAWTDAWQAAFP